MVDFAVEPLLTAQSSIEGLLPAQWAHTGDPHLECQPNWGLYYQFAQRDALLLVTAREFDDLVGYMAAFIYPHPNAMSVKVAEIPTYYVSPRQTRALILSRMQDFAVEQLIARGVYKVKIETNADYSAGRLWEHKGFKLEKLGYSMQLQRPLGERYA